MVSVNKKYNNSINKFYLSKISNIECLQIYLIFIFTLPRKVLTASLPFAHLLCDKPIVGKLLPAILNQLTPLMELARNK